MARTRCSSRSRPVRLVRQRAARQTASSPKCASKLRLRAELVERIDEERAYQQLLRWTTSTRSDIHDYRPVTRRCSRVAEPLVLDRQHRQGQLRRRAGQRPGDRRRRRCRQGHRRGSDGAQVSLITDSEVGVTAKINATGVPGMVYPKVGEPNGLVMHYLPENTAGEPGDYVVTAGTISSKDESLFPRGIPIGQVTSVAKQRRYKSRQNPSAREPAQPGHRAGPDRGARLGAAHPSAWPPGCRRIRARNPPPSPVRPARRDGSGG